MTLTDEFEKRAASVLGTDTALLKQLLTLRAGRQRELSKSRPMSADLINAENQKLFDKAADLLGPERYEAIFGVPAYTTVILVDPLVSFAPVLR